MAEEQNNWLDPVFSTTFVNFFNTLQTADGTTKQINTRQSFAKTIASVLNLSGVHEPSNLAEVFTVGKAETSFGNEATFAEAVANAWPEQYRSNDIVDKIDWQLVWNLYKESGRGFGMKPDSEQKMVEKLDNKINQWAENDAATAAQYTGMVSTADISRYIDNIKTIGNEGRNGLSASVNASGIAEPATGTSPIDQLPPASVGVPGAPTSATTSTGGQGAEPSGQQEQPPTGTSPTTTTAPSSTNMEDLNLFGAVTQEYLGSEQEWLRLNAEATLTQLDAEFGESADYVIDFSRLPSAYRPTTRPGNVTAIPFDIKKAIQYIYDLGDKDPDALASLQDHLETAGYFDMVGSTYTQPGRVDPATKLAWDYFLADSIRFDTNPGALMEDRLLNYYRSRRPASGFIGMDPAQITARTRELGSQIIGRGLSPEEERALVAQVRKWEREAALGPSYAADNYQVNIDARVQEYIGTKFEAEKDILTLSNFLAKGL